MSMPIITLLERVPIQPWFIRVFKSTMVLEREISAPNHTEAVKSQPSRRPMPMPSSMVRRICRGVPTKAITFTGFKSL